MAGDESAKGKAGQSDRAFGSHLLHHGQQILQLGLAGVILAGTGAHAAKVEAHDRVAALNKGTRQVWTTLLSMVPPNSGCGWAMMATPWGSGLRPVAAHRAGPQWHRQRR
jgi:hypothetical protein